MCLLQVYREIEEVEYKIMSFLVIGPVLFGGVAGIIQYLRQRHLLASTCDCSRYNQP